MVATNRLTQKASIRRSRLALTGAIVTLLASTVPVAGRDDRQEENSIETALLEHGVGPDHMDAGVITAWNQLAHDIAFAEDQFLTFKGQRALAMMHLAIHDALNSIAPVYERHAYDGMRPVAADPLAASAQAAYGVLVAQYSDQQLKLNAELASWLDQVPNGTLRERGIALGGAAAAAILALRADDGWNFAGTYEFRSGPGQYQTTPPWDGFVAQPGFRFARPFVLASRTELRQPPPPPLTSMAYARAFREVKEYGAVNSAHRTEDQTAYAVWWMEFAEGSVNRVARQLVVDRKTDRWTAARLFAHIGMALVDGYIAVWEEKYRFNHWRPYTAIRAADSDHNRRTTPDPSWEPLRPTPPFPEYVSAHATACAASFGVLERAFGDHGSFTMETTTAPPGMPTRAFASFNAAAVECADSRVRLGWHFRYSTDAGLTLGRRIAHHTVSRALRLRRERHGRDETSPVYRKSSQPHELPPRDQDARNASAIAGS